MRIIIAERLKKLVCCATGVSLTDSSSFCPDCGRRFGQVLMVVQTMMMMVTVMGLMIAVKWLETRKYDEWVG